MGYGETRPIADNSDPNRAGLLNRRVEVTIFEGDAVKLNLLTIRRTAVRPYIFVVIGALMFAAACKSPFGRTQRLTTAAPPAVVRRIGSASSPSSATS